VEAFNFRVGMWESFFVLFGIGIGFRILALFALKRLAKNIQ